LIVDIGVASNRQNKIWIFFLITEVGEELNCLNKIGANVSTWLNHDSKIERLNVHPMPLGRAHVLLFGNSLTWVIEQHPRDKGGAPSKLLISALHIHVYWWKEWGLGNISFMKVH